MFRTKPRLVRTEPNSSPCPRPLSSSSSPPQDFFFSGEKVSASDKRMVSRVSVRPHEGLMMMQELEDRVKEQADRLEHVRLAAVELKDNLSENHSDLTQSISDHLERLNHLSDRVETLHLNTTVFIQMNPRPRVWGAKQGSRHGSRRVRLHQAADILSEFGWSPIRTRRNSDAASEMSCNW